MLSGLLFLKCAVWVAAVAVPDAMLCLNQVVGKVLEVEDMVQTDVTRKRMKHLAHLPISGMHCVTICTSYYLRCDMQ